MQGKGEIRIPEFPLHGGIPPQSPRGESHNPELLCLSGQQLCGAAALGVPPAGQALSKGLGRGILLGNDSLALHQETAEGLLG